MTQTPPEKTSEEINEETNEEIEEILDTRGLLCPLPVLKARKKLQSLPSGTTLRILSDDAGSLTDFQHFCTEQNHTLLEQSQSSATTIVHRIRKGGICPQGEFVPKGNLSPRGIYPPVDA